MVYAITDFGGVRRDLSIFFIFSNFAADQVRQGNQSIANLLPTLGVASLWSTTR